MVGVGNRGNVRSDVSFPQDGHPRFKVGECGTTVLDRAVCHRIVRDFASAPSHGRTAYREYGCRCAICCAANSEKNREIHARAKAGQPAPPRTLPDPRREARRLCAELNRDYP